MLSHLRSTIHRIFASMLVAGFFFLASSGASVAQECRGDCDGSSNVSVSEVITCVNIALGTKDLGDCLACTSDGSAVVITDLISAVDHSLNDCPPPANTPTPTNTVESTATSTATETATATITSTSTPVDTATATPTLTNTPEDTATVTPTAEDTATPSPTATETPTPQDTATATPTRKIVIDPAFKIAFPDEVEANTVVAGDVAVDVGLPNDADPETLRVFLDGTEVPNFGMPGGTTGVEVGTVSGVIPDVDAGLHTVSAEVDVARDGGAVAVTQQDVLVLEPTATVTPTASVTPTVTDTPEGTPTDTQEPTATDTPLPTDTPTATDTVEPTNTPTPTNTAEPTPTNTVSCPITAGSYTLTQVSGGNLIVDGLPAFPFPAGGIITQDVGAPDANCVHQTVVAFPGGFSAPAFCIPGLGFTVSLAQTGCGVGRIDSDGGSDFTVTELGDTSSPTICGFSQPTCTSGGAPTNSNVQVDVTVGDGNPDDCSSGTANAIVSIPVFTTTWLSFGGCPDPDGTFNPPGDVNIVSFPQTLDFTTDATQADWSDLDPDGCCIAGAGPASVVPPCNAGGTGGFSGTGTCIDLAGANAAGADVTTVAAGAIGSAGSPLYDLTFISTLPNEISGPGEPSGATCEEPPLIDFNGKVTRCVQ
jgi:hypothetical protein